MDFEKIISHGLIGLGLLVGWVGKPIRKKIEEHWKKDHPESEEKRIKKALDFLSKLDLTDYDKDFEWVKVPVSKSSSSSLRNSNDSDKK